MNQSFNIPAGTFAGEDAAAKRRRELRERLGKGETVKIAPSGSAMAPNGEATVEVGKGKLAGEDAAARFKMEQRARIAKALREGQTVPLSRGGDAMHKDPTAVTINTPEGILAASEQWYEKNPNLLEMEKVIMQANFPQFKLEALDDGRLCWVGMLEPGIYESKFGQKRQYYVMAVYDNNHPNQKMGSSVKVYPMMPDVDELIEYCGFTPAHLLRDDVGNLYLCTNEAGDQKIGRAQQHTAASVLGWASKWLIAFELVLTGDLPLAEFNRHGGI